MIWLSMVGLVVGALLALRFKFLVLLPATLVVVVAAMGAAAQMRTASLTVLIAVVVSVTLQVGYFVGILVQYWIGVIFRAPSSTSSPTAQNRVN